MRIKDDVTYHEWKEAVEGAYNLYLHYSWSPRDCRMFLETSENEYADGFYDKNDKPCDGTIFLLALAVTEREIRLDCLEEQILLMASYHIYRYENMNRYREDFTADEIKEIERDIEYIKSKVELPKLVSYDDSILLT